MKSDFSKKKIKLHIRRSLCLAMCIVTLIGACCSSYADISAYDYSQGYRWTRIRSWSDLKEFVKDEEDQDLTTDTGWIKVLIVSDNQYYIEGERISDDGSYYLNRYSENEKYRMSYIPITSGYNKTEDQFYTASGLNAPYIKYKGWDGDNSCPKFMMRMSKDDKLGIQTWLLNCAFYGIAYHATYYSEIRFCDRKNLTSCGHGWSSSDRVREDMSFDFNGSGELGIFFNVPEVSDRVISKDGNTGLQTEDGKSNMARFKLYVGEPYDVPVETQDGDITVGETTVWSGVILARTTKINVPKGATLVIDGYTYNDGCINVNGGTLIVKGVLDSHPGQSHDKNYAFAPGFLRAENGGIILVENSGVIIQRHQDACVMLDDNSKMIVEGGMIVGGSLVLDNHSSFRAIPGTFVAIGAIAKDSVEQSKFTPNYIGEYGSYYIEDLISNSGESAVGALHGLYVTDKSSAYFDNFFMTADREKSITNGSYWSGVQNTNIHATINSMVTL